MKRHRKPIFIFKCQKHDFSKRTLNPFIKISIFFENSSEKYFLMQFDEIYIKIKNNLLERLNLKNFVNKFLLIDFSKHVLKFGSKKPCFLPLKMKKGFKYPL